MYLALCVPCLRNSVDCCDVSCFQKASLPCWLVSLRYFLLHLKSCWTFWKALPLPTSTVESCDVQLNRTRLLDSLRELGVTAEQAGHVLDSCIRDWGVLVHTGDGPELTMTVKVYKPNHSEPVISASWETVHMKLAQLFKKEFLTPQRSTPHVRFTRQQAATDVAREEHIRTQGLNDVQLQQVRDMLTQTTKPIVDKQTQSETNLQASLQAIYNSLQAIVPMLQSNPAGVPPNQAPVATHNDGAAQTFGG